jgi:hypothetical protein
VLAIARGKLPNPFVIDVSSSANWIEDIKKMAIDSNKQYGGPK